MRRFIDVVFVQPKSRYFVVLHEGQFWQLPRMNLTANSWVFRLLYKGSLKEIFVAKSQAVADERLSRTLKTYDLPKELQGLSAQRFLDWWEMNDYKWLSTKNIISLDVSQAQKNTPKTGVKTNDTKANETKTSEAKTIETQPSETKSATKTVIAPQALEILQKKHIQGQNSPMTSSLDVPANKPNPRPPPSPSIDKSTPAMPSSTMPPNTATNTTPMPNQTTLTNAQNRLNTATNTSSQRTSVRTPMSKIHEFNAQYAKPQARPATPVAAQQTAQPTPQQPARTAQPVQATQVAQTTRTPVQPTQAQQAQPKPRTIEAQFNQHPSPMPARPVAAPRPVPQPTPAPTLHQSFTQNSDNELDLDIFDNLLKELNEEVLHG